MLRDPQIPGIFTTYIFLFPVSLKSSDLSTACTILGKETQYSQFHNHTWFPWATISNLTCGVESLELTHVLLLRMPCHIYRVVWCLLSQAPLTTGTQLPRIQFPSCPLLPVEMELHVRVFHTWLELSTYNLLRSNSTPGAWGTVHAFAWWQTSDCMHRCRFA